MKPVNIFDAKSNLSRLVEAALQGEDVVIAKRGRPVIRLVPVEVVRRSTGRAVAEWFTRNSPVGGRHRTVEDIQTQLQENRDAWN